MFTNTKNRPGEAAFEVCIFFINKICSCCLFDRCRFSSAQLPDRIAGHIQIVNTGCSIKILIRPCDSRPFVGQPRLHFSTIVADTSSTFTTYTAEFPSRASGTTFPLLAGLKVAPSTLCSKDTGLRPEAENLKLSAV